jgi:NADH-quinone oxidoreductase subunit N
MFSLSKALLPEAILVVTASVLFLMGTSRSSGVRRLAPILALLALAIAMVSQLSAVFNASGVADPWQSLQVSQFSRYIKLISAGVGMLLVMLAWPSNRDSTAGPAIHFGTETGEFFALIMLSIAGLFLVAGANDMMTLFLGLELASLPTYIMVGISRPLAVAQEAGVKYFFLGALSAALMLLGFSYLYGTTGTIYLHGGSDAGGAAVVGVDAVIRAAGGGLTVWQMFAVVILILSLAFKMASFPLHVYAGDVYQGAATPVTALLSYVPKASGFVALLKILYAAGGSSWILPHQIGELIAWLALLTMSIGNVLGLLQQNIKRVLAYSSIAHSGYMLVAVAALVTAGADAEFYRPTALRGVLFYLAAYGLTNIAIFGGLILLPGRTGEPGTSAETFDDIAGYGRRHVALGLAMSISVFSLIGIPLTVGFVGKVLLIYPALRAGLGWLVVALVVNSAVSAAYYLRIIAALFLRPPAVAAGSTEPAEAKWPMPIMTAVFASVVGVLILGAAIPCIERMIVRVQTATDLDVVPPTPATPTFASLGR